MSGLSKPVNGSWRWRMRPEELPDEEPPSQEGLGGVDPLLRCVVTLAPAEAKRRALEGGEVPQVRGYCAVDTGTRVSAISIPVMNRLGIEPVDHLPMLGCSSTQPMMAPVFAATLCFPGSNVPDLVLRDFVGLNLETTERSRVAGKPVIALLGRAALASFVMIYDGLASSITLIHRNEV